MQSIKTTSPAEVNKAEMIIMSVKAGYSPIDHYEMSSEWVISKYEIRLFLRFITKWYQRIDTISIVKPEESELLTDEEIEVYTSTAELGYAYGYESEYDFESGNYVTSGRQRYMPYWIEHIPALSSGDVLHLNDGVNLHRKTLGIKTTFDYACWQNMVAKIDHQGLSEESERFLDQREYPYGTFCEPTVVVGTRRTYADGSKTVTRTSVCEYYSEYDYNNDVLVEYGVALLVPEDPTGEESGEYWEDAVLSRESELTGVKYFK